MGGGSVEEKFRDSGWIYPTMTSGWKQFTNTHPPLRYRVIGNRVFLQGCISNTSAIVNQTTIFTMPKEYTPYYNLIFDAPNSESVNKTCVIYGNNMPSGYGEFKCRSTLEVGKYIVLDGISWLID